MPNETSQPTVTVRNDYKWIADPRLARLSLYLDGKRAAKVDLGSEVTLSVSADEQHTIQVGLWFRWFTSPGKTVELRRDGSLLLSGDIDRSLSAGRRMLRMLMHPHKSLVLNEVV